MGIPPGRYRHADPSVGVDSSAVNESEWNKYKLSEDAAVWLPGWMRKESARYLFPCQSWVADRIYLKIAVLFFSEAKSLSAIKRKCCFALENIIY